MVIVLDVCWLGEEVVVMVILLYYIFVLMVNFLFYFVIGV